MSICQVMIRTKGKEVQRIVIARIFIYVVYVRSTSTTHRASVIELLKYLFPNFCWDDYSRLGHGPILAEKELLRLEHSQAILSHSRN